MEYCRGDRVRILGKPEWGPGLVQERSKNGRVKVVFRHAGAKTLSLTHAKLMKVILRDAKWLEERTRAVQKRKRMTQNVEFARALPVGDWTSNVGDMGFVVQRPGFVPEGAAYVLRGESDVSSAEPP